jgi:hypothetical protein
MSETPNDKQDALQGNSLPPAYALEDFLPILLRLLMPDRPLTSPPDFTPKTFLDCIQFYVDGSGAYYLYVFMEGAWRIFPAGSAVSQILAGSGISVSPGGGTGAVTVTNLGVKSLIAGPGISVSGATGDITIENTATAAQHPKAVLVTRGGSDISSVQVIPHTLSAAPRYVRVTAWWGATNPELLQSVGTSDADADTATLIGWTLVGATGGADSSTADIVNLSRHDGSNTQSATVYNLDATNFELDWTKAGSGLGGTIHLLCEFFP